MAGKRVNLQREIRHCLYLIYRLDRVLGSVVMETAEGCR